MTKISETETKPACAACASIERAQVRGCATCGFCTAKDALFAKGAGASEEDARSSASTEKKSGGGCFYCRAQGHRVAECPKLEALRARDADREFVYWCRDQIRRGGYWAITKAQRARMEACKARLGWN